ncbi:MAG: hypothetical protein GF383_10115, partial [Candidatus Lokiarchaeota archaeon]|nr:hypothetical protein [Candidatus Lokiarchaeota archaeon]MBD3340920.1 hypothetical protein [Candidatus Lokiarchaeota archaeon]
MRRDIVQAKFNINIPKSKWLAVFSNQFSHLNIKILSKYLISNDIGITSLQIKGPITGQTKNKLIQILSLESFQILHTEPNLLILNVKVEDPYILNALIKTELLLRYPLKVKNGKIHLKVLAVRSKVDQFLSELEKNNIKFDLISISHYAHSAILTQKQAEVLKRAYEEGYYEIPRRISLSKLAKKLDISPSALSELFRRIHFRLANNY